MTNTYLIAGQSNALGISPVSNLAQPCEYPGVFLYQASNVSVPFGHTIITVRPGLGIKSGRNSAPRAPAAGSGPVSSSTPRTGRPCTTAGRPAAGIFWG